MGGTASTLQDFKNVAQTYESNKDKLSDAEMLELLKGQLSHVPDNLFQQIDYEACRKDILEVMNDPSWDDGTYAPIFIRLAWHSSGTYDKESGTGERSRSCRPSS